MRATHACFTIVVRRVGETHREAGDIDIGPRHPSRDCNLAEGRRGLSGGLHPPTNLGGRCHGDNSRSSRPDDQERAAVAGQLDREPQAAVGPDRSNRLVRSGGTRTAAGSPRPRRGDRPGGRAPCGSCRGPPRGSTGPSPRRPASSGSARRPGGPRGRALPASPWPGAGPTDRRPRGPAAPTPGGPGRNGRGRARAGLAAIEPAGTASCGRGRSDTPGPDSGPDPTSPARSSATSNVAPDRDCVSLGSWA